MAPRAQTTPLVDAMRRLARTIEWRWHTPGHKGRAPQGADFLAWEMDWTEVGALADPEGPWAQAERKAAERFGSRRSWFSVQGATLPVLVAILAAFAPGSRVAVDRYAHRSVLSALILAGLFPKWLYPRWAPGGVPVPAAPNWEALAAETDGLVLTRPTYEGIALPRAALEAAILAYHRRGKPVVVDEAHGAHWWGRQGFPTSALAQGADLVVHGPHKTEPALTQTGVLHWQGQHVDGDRIEAWWRRLATSSPSYLLLASLDHWLARWSEVGRAWEALAARAGDEWRRLEARGHQVWQLRAAEAGWEVDPAKLTLLGPGLRWRERLAPRHQAEKADPGSITFILAPHVPTGRLMAALGALFPEPPPAWTGEGWPEPPVRMAPREATEGPSRWVALDRAVGQVAAEALVPYPPGVPLVCPGEEITPEVVAWATAYQQAGTVAGMRAGAVRVVESRTPGPRLSPDAALR
ncbi:MAG: arginine decarboxylase [Firmicutes bacterium]|nr:arginine decarboxylase [Alicyclobacillaceae bacterium]MCL6497239.1 arginine decarboxylase [Bacillota bacterium]